MRTGWINTVATRSDEGGVRAAISRAAQRTGVDFTYLLNQARTESGLNPHARARTSSATGLYQFIDQSWLGVLKRHGATHGYGWAADAISQRRGGGYTVDPQARAAVFALRKDADASAVMAAEFAADNAAGLERALGRSPGSTDLYFAHFLGLDGASRFLRAHDANPDMAASAMFPREARANPSIFYRKSGEARSLGQIYQLMARKLGGDGAVAPVQMARAAPAELDTKALNQMMLASLQGRGQMNVLRPNPQQATLAYMMVSMPTTA